MTRMRLETKEKLKQIARLMLETYGSECLNWSNYKSLLVEAAQKLNEPMSRLTLDKYQNYLKTIMVNEIKNASIQDAQIPPVEVAKEEVIKVAQNEPLVVQKVVIYYTNGTSVEVPSQLQKTTEVWLGLFEYHDDGAILIRRGKMSGCDVRKKQSILEHFKTFDWFEQWCQGRLEDVKLSKIVPNPDTPRDIETLKKLLRNLQALRSSNII